MTEWVLNSQFTCREVAEIEANDCEKQEFCSSYLQMKDQTLNYLHIIWPFSHFVLAPVYLEVQLFELVDLLPTVVKVFPMQSLVFLLHYYFGNWLERPCLLPLIIQCMSSSSHPETQPATSKNIMHPPLKKNNTDLIVLHHNFVVKRSDYNVDLSLEMQPCPLLIPL